MLWSEKIRSMNIPEINSWFDAAGPPAGKPIILIHGTRLTRRMWLPQVKALSRKYQVVVPDMPGHGALKDIPFRLETAAETVDRIFDTAITEKALLVGLSMGGYVAMEFAFRHPERVRGLVLSGCSTNPRGAIIIPHRIGAFFTRILSEKLLSSLNRYIFRRMFPPEIADPIIADGFYFRAVPQIVSEIAGLNFSKMVSGIPVPILFLNGEKDVIFRQDELVFLASAQNAKLEIIPGANHLCSLQKPAAFNSAIENFAAALGW